MIQENMTQENLELTNKAASQTGLSKTTNLNTDIDNTWMTDSLKLSVMFMTNSAGLSDSDHKTIEALSDIMHQFPELNLKLDGYTDPRGSTKENLELAKLRVDAVKQVFESYAVNTSRILTKAHGEMQGVSLEDGNDVFAMARKVNVNFTLEPIETLITEETLISNQNSDNKDLANPHSDKQGLDQEIVQN